MKLAPCVHRYVTNYCRAVLEKKSSLSVPVKVFPSSRNPSMIFSSPVSCSADKNCGKRLTVYRILKTRYFRMFSSTSVPNSDSGKILLYASGSSNSEPL